LGGKLDWLFFSKLQSLSTESKAFRSASQAYDEGSIPFTRSSKINNLATIERPQNGRSGIASPEQVGIGKKKVLSIETPRAIGHAFRAVVKEAEFPDLRWHDLRHEAISRLFENTDLRDNEIMAITGHLSTEMLKRYSHLRSHRLATRLG
jgi:Phage integrase family